MTDIQWIIFGIFGLLFIVLNQSRELMRQIGRTAEEWHRMRAAFKRPRHGKRHVPVAGSSNISDGRAVESNTGELPPLSK